MQRKWLRVKEHATIEIDYGRDSLNAILRMIYEEKHARFIKQEKKYDKDANQDCLEKKEHKEHAKKN